MMSGAFPAIISVRCCCAEFSGGGSGLISKLGDFSANSLAPCSAIFSMAGTSVASDVSQRNVILAADGAAAVAPVAGAAPPAAVGAAPPPGAEAPQAVATSPALTAVIRLSASRREIGFIALLLVPLLIQKSRSCYPWPPQVRRGDSEADDR